MGQETRQDDQALVEEAIGGSVEAFEALVARYQDRIFGMIHRMVNDPERARDLTQESFLKAWKGLSGFQAQSAFFTWLYRISRNVVMSAGRYDAARPRLRQSLDDRESDGPKIDPETVAKGPRESMLAEEQRVLVLDAIASLPGDFREIVVLRDMEDRPYEEIAELLDIPVGTVRSRLHRARLELKNRLKRVLDPAG